MKTESKNVPRNDTEENRLIKRIAERYGGEPDMLIPMMQDIQADIGYLPADHLRLLAEHLQVPLSRVYAVATFYSSFRLAPKGLHEVTLCVGTVCHLKGAHEILDAVCKEFQVEAGGTTPDGLFSLQAVNCVGACALAPVMIVDGEYHDHVTPQSGMQLLRELPRDEAPEESEAAT